MAARALPTTALLLSLNLFFFILVSSTDAQGPSPNASEPTCPRGTLKLGVCVDVLKKLLGLVVGTPQKTPCCTLIEGLADFEADICLCTAIKADVLGSSLDIPLSLSLLLDFCDKGVPSGFQCS